MGVNCLVTLRLASPPHLNPAGFASVTNRRIQLKGTTRLSLWPPRQPLNLPNYKHSSDFFLSSATSTVEISRLCSLDKFKIRNLHKIAFSLNCTPV